MCPGVEGGRYGNERETEEMLRTIAESGRGRCHHFRISGLVNDYNSCNKTEVTIAQLCLLYTLHLLVVVCCLR